MRPQAPAEPREQGFGASIDLDHDLPERLVVSHRIEHGSRCFPLRSTPVGRQAIDPGACNDHGSFKFHFQMSLTFRTAVTASLAGFMVACGGGGDTQVVGRAPGTSAGSDKIAALEASGDIPKLDRTDSLAGTDANSNGVRDDVDAFIHQQFSEEAHRNAALQLAQALQATLFVPAGDVIQGKAAARRVTRGINCVFDSFNGSGKAGLVVDQLESITANTKIRLRTYLAYNRTLSGTVSTMPSGDTCE